MSTGWPMGWAWEWKIFGKVSKQWPKNFSMDLSRRIVDRIMIWLIRAGRGPTFYSLLTVPGRKTGRPHTKPIVLVEQGNERWLVGPYGEVDWVKNTRTAGEVILSRGKVVEPLTIRELLPAESAPVLKQYLIENPITAPYFNAKPDSPLEVFETEAATRPVFALHPKEETP